MGDGDDRTAVDARGGGRDSHDGHRNRGSLSDHNFVIFHGNFHRLQNSVSFFLISSTFRY